MVALGEVDGNASKSEAFETEEAAVDWIAGLRRAALGGVDPTAATMKLADYGAVHMTLALRAWRPRPSTHTCPVGANELYLCLATSRYE